MLTDDVLECVVKKLHDCYEAAAVKNGWETQARSRKPWDEVPEENKQTMRDAVTGAWPLIADIIISDFMDDVEQVAAKFPARYNTDVSLVEILLESRNGQR